MLHRGMRLHARAMLHHNGLAIVCGVGPVLIVVGKIRALINVILSIRKYKFETFSYTLMYGEEMKHRHPLSSRLYMSLIKFCIGNASLAK